MRRLPFPAAAVLVALGGVLLPAAAHATDLVVTVTGVRPDTGDVRVVIIADPDGMARQDMSQNLRAETAKNGAITTHFLGVAPGRYGVMALHDRHVNHALEKTLTGKISKPESVTSEARVTVSGRKAAVTLALK